MSADTVLTDEQIMICLVSLYEKHQSEGIGELYLKSDLVPIGRAIEQAVLQSPEVQALRKDAERYRKVRRMTLHQYSDLYTHCLRTGAYLDRVLDISNDAAMEKQP